MTGHQRDWPEWWEWELRISSHARRRMSRRHFNEADLRALLADATGISPDVAPGRWVAAARRHGTDWEVVVEPDSLTGRLVVVTAYPLE